MTITAVSPVYETVPWGETDQPDFLNICLAAETTLEPGPLLDKLKELELTIGRQPGARWGPRLIDIDLLFYDDLVWQDERLVLPHPRIAGRAFVLAPLADIAPDLVDPQTGLIVTQMLAGVDREAVRRLPQPLNVTRYT